MSANGENFRLDDQIGFLLRRAHHQASGHFAARLRPYDMNPQQFSTLARLLERGPTAQNSLGESVGMARANIHTMVQRLAKRGLVATRDDPDDSRRRIVELTDAGRALVKELIPLDAQSTEDALAMLDAAERATVYRLLRRLAGDSGKE